MLVEGLNRAEIIEFYDEENYYSVKIKIYEDSDEKDVEDQALMRTMLDYFEQYIKLSKKISAETYSSVAILKNQAEWLILSPPIYQ